MVHSGGVVVTGAAGGIGGACALRLDRLGFRVFGTILPGEDAQPLQTEASERLAILEMDVMDSASIAAAASTVSEALGDAGLAGLVNVAGVHAAAGPLEFLPIEALRRQFEVNVVGQVAVTQAFLPLLRRGSGRIVMMGSVYSHVPCPFGSPYGASKAALRSLAGALRGELRSCGIPVSVIEPGPVATPLWSKAIGRLEEIAGTLPREAHELYGPALDTTRAFLSREASAGDSAEAVAAAVATALRARKPKPTYTVGRDARLTRLVMRLTASDRVRGWLAARAMRLPRPWV
jgi:NAD(P)-dependent dehydrogenase (short-subunit alcohol dehydrogenase family)